MSLEPQELAELKSKIGRAPTSTELQIVAAEWSEHCSYKSSKKHLKMLPMKGPLVIHEKGYDSGVLDVGNGYVVTAHIESHNHPSAVEPYGGAATGVGGVIRDILSAGTRPIAILNGLRFGNIEKDQQARWLFKNAVTGIADYGNCLGIPTIGGEVEFDDCYQNYALVDVAAVGFGKKSEFDKKSYQERRFGCITWRLYRKRWNGWISVCFRFFRIRRSFCSSNPRSIYREINHRGNLGGKKSKTNQRHERPWRWRVVLCSFRDC